MFIFSFLVIPPFSKIIPLHTIYADNGLCADTMIDGSSTEHCRNNNNNTSNSNTNSSNNETYGFTTTTATTTTTTTTITTGGEREENIHESPLMVDGR